MPNFSFSYNVFLVVIADAELSLLFPKQRDQGGDKSISLRRESEDHFPELIYARALVNYDRKEIGTDARVVTEERRANGHVRFR